MTPRHAIHRLGSALIALLVLVTSSASFHGYLLQPACAPVQEACCSHEPAGEPTAPESDHEDGSDCHEACCFAVSMAVMASPGTLAASLGSPGSPPAARVAPRRTPTSLFRPPLA